MVGVDHKLNHVPDRGYRGPVTNDPRDVRDDYQFDTIAQDDLDDRSHSFYACPPIQLN